MADKVSARWPLLVALAGATACAGTINLRHAPVAVAAHALAAALLWFAARRLGVHYGTAILAGLLFAVAGPFVLAAGGFRASLPVVLSGATGAWLLLGSRVRQRPVLAGGTVSAVFLVVGVAAPAWSYLALPGPCLVLGHCGAALAARRQRNDSR